MWFVLRSSRFRTRFLLGTSARLRRSFCGVRLRREFNPVGPVEHLLVDELAHRAGQVYQLDLALDLYRAQAASAMLSIQGSNSPQDEQAAIVAIMASDKHESLLGQGLAVSRGMFRALHELQSLLRRSPCPQPIGFRQTRDFAVNRSA